MLNAMSIPPRQPSKRRRTTGTINYSWVFSGLTIAIITAIVIITQRGKPDELTWRVGPKMLEVRNFQKLAPLASPRPGDASAQWENVWAWHESQKGKLNALEPTKEQAETAIDLIMSAGEAGTVSAKFLDATIPTKPKAYPSSGDAMRETAFVAMRKLNLQFKAGGAGVQRAERGADAVFAIGYTMFDKSRRVPIRNEGLDMMRNVADLLLEWYPEGHPKRPLAKEWNDALDNFVIDFWEPKWSICYSNRPDSIGDIVKLARDDKDVSWRVEAVLGMSWVKFAKGRGQANDRAMRQALEDLTKDANPVVAEAAKIASTYTAENVKTMR